MVVFSLIFQNPNLVIDFPKSFPSNVRGGVPRSTLRLSRHEYNAEVHLYLFKIYHGHWVTRVVCPNFVINKNINFFQLSSGDLIFSQHAYSIFKVRKPRITKIGQGVRSQSRVSKGRAHYPIDWVFLFQNDEERHR